LLAQAITNLANNMGVMNNSMGSMTTNLSTVLTKMDTLASSLDRTNQVDYVLEDNDYEDVSYNYDPSTTHKRTSSELSEQDDEDNVEQDSKKAKFFSMLKAESKSVDAKGPKINEQLASSITEFMRNKPEESKTRELYESILTPENCPGLDKITVNEAIWSRISSEDRSHDAKMQRPQNALIKGVTSFAQMFDCLLESWDGETEKLAETKMTEIMEMATKAFKAFGAANFELVMRRREGMKHAISKDYAHLCAPSVPFSDKLFGDDVNKTIKEIDEENKVNRKAVLSRQPLKPKQQYNQQRSFNYPGPSTSYQGYRNQSRDRGRNYRGHNQGSNFSRYKEGPARGKRPAQPQGNK